MFAAIAICVLLVVKRGYAPYSRNLPLFAIVSKHRWGGASFMGTLPAN